MKNKLLIVIIIFSVIFIGWNSSEDTKSKKEVGLENNTERSIKVQSENQIIKLKKFNGELDTNISKELKLIGDWYLHNQLVKPYLQNGSEANRLSNCLDSYNGGFIGNGETTKCWINLKKHHINNFSKNNINHEVEKISNYLLPKLNEYISQKAKILNIQAELKKDLDYSIDSMQIISEKYDNTIRNIDSNWKSAINKSIEYDESFGLIDNTVNTAFDLIGGGGTKWNRLQKERNAFIQEVYLSRKAFAKDYIREIKYKFKEDVNILLNDMYMEDY